MFSCEGPSGAVDVSFRSHRQITAEATIPTDSDNGPRQTTLARDRGTSRRVSTSLYAGPVPTWLTSERRDQIRKQLDRWGTVRTGELAVQFSVSERTVQRDLDALEMHGTAQRVHGGAICPVGSDELTRLRIGLIVPSRTSYYEQVVAGVLEAAAQKNVQVIIGDYAYRDELEADRLDLITKVGLDGLLVTVEDRGVGYEQLRDIAQPIVLLERPQLPVHTDTSAPLIAHVCSDHASGAALGLEYLYALGHRSIFCLIRRTPTAAGILRGLHGSVPRPDRRFTVREVHRDLPLGSSTPVLLDVVDAALTGTATAFLVHHDADAAAVVAALSRAGISVPRDASVLSYDDVEAAGTDPPLSAISPQRRWIGRLACEVLVTRLRGAGETLPPVPTFQLSLPPELVVRGSTAPPRNRAVAAPPAAEIQQLPPGFLDRGPRRRHPK